MDYEPLGESDAAFAPIGSIHGGFPWDFHHISASPIWIDPGDCSRKPFLHVSIVKTSELPNKWSMSSMNHPGLSEKRLPHATLKFTGLFWLSPWNYHNGNCHNLRVYYISFWDTTLQIVGDLEVGPWSEVVSSASEPSEASEGLMPPEVPWRGSPWWLVQHALDLVDSNSNYSRYPYFGAWSPVTRFRSWATNQWCLDWSPILPIYFGSRGLALVAL